MTEKECKTINKIKVVNKYPIEKMDIAIKGKILYMISSEMHNMFVLTDNGYFYVINKGKLNDIEGFELKSDFLDPEKVKNSGVKFQSDKKESQIWCNKLGTHVIIKYKNVSFYYNPLMAKKIDELNLIMFNEFVQPYAVAFNDDFYEPEDTGKILISDYNSVIYDLQLKLSEEKELIRLTFGEVFKFRIEKIKNLIVEDEDEEFNFFKMEENDRILDMKLIVSENPTMGVSKVGNEDKNIFILAITKHILFQFYGKNDFKDVFENYSLEKGKILKAYKKFISPLKIDYKYSRIQLLNEEKSAELIFGFMTQCGYIMGKFENGRIPVPQKNFNVIKYFKPSKENEEIIPSQVNQIVIPKTVCQSKNHIFFLYHDCLVIQNKLTKRIIHDEYLKEPYLDMYYNQILNGIILYNEKGIYKIPLELEFRYLFEDYIEIGNFAKALELLSKADINLKPKLHKIYADHLFENHKYLEAASEYAFSDEIFEHVCIKFLSTNNNLALIRYLSLINHFRIKSKSNANNVPSEKESSHFIEKYLINTWILELLFGKNENVKLDKLTPNTKLFIRTTSQCLDKNLIYFILNIYGKDKELIEFASLKQDYETIILYLINQKKINESIDNITLFLTFGQENVNKLLKKIFLNYANLFIKEYPKETINILKEYFKTCFSEVDIMRTLISPNFYILSGFPDKFSALVKYIENLIQKPIKDGETELNLTKNQNLHNLYILLLSHLKEQNNKGKLIDYLKRPIENYELTKKYNPNINIDEKIYFDLYFAKKIFENPKDNIEAKALCLILYLLKLYPESIDVAIEKGFKELIPFLPKNIPDQNLKKKIWLQIFEHIKQSNDLSEAKKIITDSEGVLKIEDILPLMGDNVKINEFKNELKDCIGKYEKSVRLLQKEIKEFNNSNDLINKDIDFSEKKAIKMNYTRLRCYKCNKNIKGPKFFMFPCQHIFDAECLIETYKEFNKHNLGDKNFKIKVQVITQLYRKIKQLTERKQKSLEIEQKSKELESLGTLQRIKTLNLNNIKSLLSKEINKIQFSTEEESMLNDTKKMLFDYLNEECLLCGKEMINSTQVDFGDEDDLEWEFI